MTGETINTVSRIAAAYPPDAAVTPLADRVANFTALQHFAWAERFAPGSTTLAAIEQLHSAEGTR